MNGRQCLVRIDICIAMAGEMLGKCQYVLRLHSFDVGDRLFCNLNGIFAERAPADNRIIRIVVHINHRSKVGIQPHTL